jgi:hypothetical protein
LLDCSCQGGSIVGLFLSRRLHCWTVLVKDLRGQKLTANVILLIGAGHETTVNLIGNGLLALYRHPEQLQLLKSDLSLTSSAIEELLRFDSSVQVTGRTTLQYVDEIGGILKRANRLFVSLARPIDAGVYSDPDRLDITRRDVRPLSFGAAFTTALAPNLPALRPRSRLQPCYVACQIRNWMTSSIPIGGRHLSCVASISCRLVGRSKR